MAGGWQRVASWSVASFAAGALATSLLFVMNYDLVRKDGAGASAGPLAVASDAPTVSGEIRIPVVGVAAKDLSDTFAQGREAGARRHDAIDILAPRGTPVVAALSGRVEKLFESERGGLTVYVRSPDGTVMAYYAHLDRYVPALAEGQQVRPGDALGTVGSTGNAPDDAPHLHFALMRTTPDANWSEGEPFNPYPLLVRAAPSR